MQLAKKYWCPHGWLDRPWQLQVLEVMWLCENLYAAERQQAEKIGMVQKSHIMDTWARKKSDEKKTNEKKFELFGNS